MSGEQLNTKWGDGTPWAALTKNDQDLWEQLAATFSKPGSKR